MSEYQYYEFQAVDRPLTREQMAELRALSSRATITPTRLQNVYHWGDFKGTPLTLMERYFDAFVYVANWGTHTCMLRLPRRALDLDLAQRACTGDIATLHVQGEHAILEFSSEGADGDWIEDEESESWLPTLLPLRAELAAGDLRSLYLAWLATAQAEFLDDDVPEPPVPPGLSDLTASQAALVEFLRIDRDLIAAAAEQSPTAPTALSRTDLARGIQSLPAAEKDGLLLRLAAEDGASVRSDLLRRLRQPPAAGVSANGTRTVGDLLIEAEARCQARQRADAERQAAERARREQAEAAARARYLDSLAGQEEGAWRQVDALVELKRAREYDQAVQLLKDLYDLSIRQQRPKTFTARLGPLLARNAKRTSLLERIQRAGLSV